jgi:hypothetical protein
LFNRYGELGRDVLSCSGLDTFGATGWRRTARKILEDSRGTFVNILEKAGLNALADCTDSLFSTNQMSFEDAQFTPSYWRRVRDRCPAVAA